MIRSKTTTPIATLLAATTVATCLAAAPAAALTVQFKPVSQVDTAVSGKRGIVHSTSPGFGYYTDALRGLEWEEGSDLPCHFQTFKRSLADGSDTSLGGYWSECPGGSWGDKRVVSFDDRPRYYVRGIAVCDSKNKNNDRIKGIRLYAAKVWKNRARIDRIASPISATHTNCGTWKRAVYCPTGSVAFGLLIHHELDSQWPGGLGHSAVGLALRCGEVDWR